jgi:hypothetical protein
LEGLELERQRRGEPFMAIILRAVYTATSAELERQRSLPQSKARARNHL